MTKQFEFDKTFLDIAELFSKHSYCKRKQVGAIITKNNSIISDGYNGTITGQKNDCEDKNGETFWYVLHAEANAISKLAKSSQSCEGATLYLTLSPCKECSKLIIQSGIKRLVFSKLHSDESGLELLHKSKIKINYVEKN